MSDPGEDNQRMLSQLRTRIDAIDSEMHRLLITRGTVIDALIVTRILVQFMGQILGLILLRRRAPARARGCGHRRRRVGHPRGSDATRERTGRRR